MISVSVEALGWSRNIAANHVEKLGYDARDFAAQMVASLVNQGALGVVGERAAEPSAPSFGIAQASEHAR